MFTLVYCYNACRLRLPRKQPSVLLCLRNVLVLEEMTLDWVGSNALN